MIMPIWRTDDRNFRRLLAALKRKLSMDEGLTAAGANAKSPRDAVLSIIGDVREDGDAALLEYTRQLDGCDLTAGQLRVADSEIEAALERCPAEYLNSLRKAADRVRRFQQATLVRDPEPLEEDGRSLRMRYTPVDSAGLCVPGGVASLASSVLMCAVPAKVAGVKRVAMVTPPRPDGSVTDDRLAAAHVAGVDEIYRIGGAQAVAALAWGTETISPVDFIAGPGNIYTTLAKKEAFGRVGIEALPGPSEVVIIADETADVDWVAADLIAQAEHNPGSSILLTDSEDLAADVADAVDGAVADLPRANETRTCLASYGAVVMATSVEECIELTNELAPEHLQIITADPEGAAARVRHAGAIFLGPWTPVPVGDYIAGPSHVLPTGMTARFSGGLSANDFLKRSSVISYDRAALLEDANDIERMARAEGLEGHARSVGLRKDVAQSSSSSGG
ncbi:MAG: histidinol dehydrogenase [Candidatus Brocadiia bacterium]